ncbi:MAG: class I SAM-dependent methyltransferase [Candidatus Dormibacteria bacterium]
MLTDHARQNRDAWNADSPQYQERHRVDLEGDRALAWGCWRIPEAELNILGDVRGRDILEFGCGGAQFSVALARLGANMTGLDLSPAQLEHARAHIDRHGVDVRLIEASGEDVPLPDSSFDIVFCDHGVMSFAKPELAVPEAARLLRPAGLFAFSRISPLVDVCWDQAADVVQDRLVGDYFEMDRLESEGTVEFFRGYGQWIRVFRDAGLIVEDLIELQAPPDRESTYDTVPAAWARRWPAEVIWKLRKP